MRLRERNARPGYFIHGRRHINSPLQKLNYVPSCKPIATTCLLRTLVASPTRELLQLFHEAVVGNQQVAGFLFLHKGSVLCLESPCAEPSLFIDLCDSQSIESYLQRLDVTHLLIDLHLGASSLDEECQEYVSNLIIAAK